jgi:hypothetical protein
MTTTSIPRLVDHDWAVHDIVASSMCDDHSALPMTSAAAVSAAAAAAAGGGNASSKAEAIELTRSLREPLRRVLRLELLVEETVPASGEGGASAETRMRPHLLELSAREAGTLIAALQSRLDAIKRRSA